MPLDLFTPVVPVEEAHPNFLRLIQEHDGGVRKVVAEWAEGFVDRDAKFVSEFQRTFNSSWWELYLFAVLKSLSIEVDFSYYSPDFVAKNADLTLEAVIASHAEGSTPEWLKTIADLANPDDVEQIYLKSMTRLSNAIAGKRRSYSHHYSDLAHVKGKPFVIAMHNFGTPDAHQLGDVAMQRLLYDVRNEEQFLKDGRTPLPAGLFRDDRCKDVSAVLSSSLATFGKARALSDCHGKFLFRAGRIFDHIDLRMVVAYKSDYRETLRDGLHLYRNPFAEVPLADSLFDVDDIQQFRVRDGELEVTCNPEGDLCNRDVIHLIEKDELSSRGA